MTTANSNSVVLVESETLVRASKMSTIWWHFTLENPTSERRCVQCARHQFGGWHWCWPLISPLNGSFGATVQFTRSQIHLWNCPPQTIGDGEGTYIMQDVQAVNFTTDIRRTETEIIIFSKWNCYLFRDLLTEVLFQFWLTVKLDSKRTFSFPIHSLYVSVHVLQRV